MTLRGSAELADALPYLLGFHPTDSAVLVALHGEHGQFGGRVRLGLPEDPAEWPDMAEQLMRLPREEQHPAQGQAGRHRALPLPGPT